MTGALFKAGGEQAQWVTPRERIPILTRRTSPGESKSPPKKGTLMSPTAIPVSETPTVDAHCPVLDLFANSTPLQSELIAN